MERTSTYCRHPERRPAPAANGTVPTAVLGTSSPALRPTGDRFAPAMRLLLRTLTAITALGLGATALAGAYAEAHRLPDQP